MGRPEETLLINEDYGKYNNIRNIKVWEITLLNFTVHYDLGVWIIAGPNSLNNYENC